MGQGKGSSSGIRLTAFQWEVYKKTLNKDWNRRLRSHFKNKRRKT